MIELKNVSYTYPNGIRALDDVNIRIEEGEKVFLSGKTGSGKSTLLRLLNGLIPNFYGGRVKGEVYAFGKPSPKHVFFISQHPEEQILTNRVRDEIRLPLYGKVKNEVEKVEEVAEICGIDKLLDKKTHELSDGEKQLVMIATALAANTPCIVLDEPFSHLHPETAQKILDLLLECDKTIVMSEHRIELAKKFDRAIWLGDKIEDEVKVVGQNVKKANDDIAIELKSINFSYSKKLFEDFSLKIPKGGVYAITGKNGSGKTTLLKIIAGLIKVEGVRVNGRVSIALQYPNYHFCENAVKKEANEKWIKLMELEQLRDRHPHSLSGGEAKRLSIAKALDADIVLLDEPTAGQDYEFRVRLLEILRRSKKTVVMATHDEKLASMCDEVVEL
ncbi:ribose ABC transporter ATP-binding protein [Archaeoglobales archaeon]|nr:MAG: ribose ABC transporter ATP-binding protein [Archaeoglobales archaeon]